jgi:hypothetical protein
VYDILTAEDGRVTWGNGQMYYKGESCWRMEESRVKDEEETKWNDKWRGR